MQSSRQFRIRLVTLVALLIGGLLPRPISARASGSDPSERTSSKSGTGNTGVEASKVAVSSAAAGTIPAPKDVIGFAPGEDKKLASWPQIVEYFRRLAAASNRVKFSELGKTTLSRPFVLATISSPTNLAKLDYYRDIQRKLADPRTINSDDAAAEKLIAEGRNIVMITCGIHSTEVGGNLVSMNIAYRLASDNSPATREILDNCIILLVPSLNPDGVDIVKAWYDKTLGTSSEGTSPPELYHHYTGHDNNRDWYAFTQVETQLTIDKVHNVWHPEIVHDIHQQGPTGSRFFLPPYVDPWEPNVPPRIQAGVNFMGSSIAWELIGQGKAGVVIDGVYDAWTPARAYQHYHGGIRILSETASGKIATPIDVPFDKLTPQINVDPKVRTWNFPLVWRGGHWSLSDIVSYMEAGAFALMRNAAHYRDRWVRDFYLVGKDAVAPRKSDEPYAYLIPPPGSAGSAPQEDVDHKIIDWENYGLARTLSILQRGDVEVYRAKTGFSAGGTQYPAGTVIVPLTQPYGSFAKTLLERQHYPDIREYPGGPPRRPYDVTAQTLPLLMGLKADLISAAFEMPQAERLSLETDPPTLQDSSTLLAGNARIAIYKNHEPSMDEGWTRWMFDQLKIKYSSLLDDEIRQGNLNAKYDCVIIPDQAPRAIMSGLSAKSYPADIAGGMGEAGLAALKQFVEAGGTIITLNRASEFAIERFGVPVKNVLMGVPPKDFYCPGSILRIDFDPRSELSIGVPRLDGGLTGEQAAAWFEEGPALDPTGEGAKVIARFGPAEDTLLSGWLLGREKITGHGAIVEAQLGKGKVVLFAFSPQYRGQSWASLPFLLNAMRASARP